MILYDDDIDKYFPNENEAIEYYLENQQTPEETFYAVKPVTVEDSWVRELSDFIVEYLDENCPELAPEDEWFSDSLKEEDYQELEDLLRNWLAARITTVAPDYSTPVSIREEYDAAIEDLRND